MRAKDLIEYLSEFPADTPVYVWQWDHKQGRGWKWDCEPALNTEHQHAQGEVMLRCAEGTMQPS